MKKILCIIFMILGFTGGIFLLYRAGVFSSASDDVDPEEDVVLTESEGGEDLDEYLDDIFVWDEELFQEQLDHCIQSGQEVADLETQYITAIAGDDEVIYDTLTSDYGLPIDNTMWYQFQTSASYQWVFDIPYDADDNGTIPVMWECVTDEEQPVLLAYATASYGLDNMFHDVESVITSVGLERYLTYWDEVDGGTGEWVDAP